MMHQDLVSLIMTVHNSADYLNEPFESIIAQSYSNFELLIINDASTDSSRSHIDEFISNHSELTVSYFENIQNLGQAASLNIGLENAKGDYICLLDSDDRLSPNFITRMVDKISQSLDFVYCGFDMVDTTNGEVIHFEENRTYLDNSVEIIRQYMDARNHFAFVGAIYRKAFLDQNSIRFNPVNRYGCDIEFVCELFLKAPRCGSVHESLYYYLVRPGSLSTDSECPNIFHCVEAMERIERKIPARGKRLRFVLTRKANIIFHVVLELYEKQVKKDVSSRLKWRYAMHFVLEIFRNPKRKLKRKNIDALAFFIS